MKYALIFGSALFTASCSANVTAPINTPSQESKISQFLAEFMPTHYQKVHEQPVPTDAQQVQWIRFQKSPSFRLGEENFSYLSDAAHNLKGFSYLDASLVHGNLPSKVQAQKIADDFYNVMHLIYCNIEKFNGLISMMKLYSSMEIIKKFQA
jgi:hypothetical protein